MKIVFDIDGTICTQETDYRNAVPYKGRIKKLNELYDQGNIIHLHTARGYETGIDWREVTEKQLIEWGVKYHSLLFGKPSADIYVDDRGINALRFDW